MGKLFGDGEVIVKIFTIMCAFGKDYARPKLYNKECARERLEVRKRIMIDNDCLGHRCNGCCFIEHFHNGTAKHCR